MECFKTKIKKKGTHIKPFIEEYVQEALLRYQKREELFSEVLSILAIE